VSDANADRPVQRLVVTGGGTAGHVVPALPIMQAFIDAGTQVDFIGSGSEFERTLVADLDATYHGIAAGKLRRYFSLENLLDAFKVLFGMLQAMLLIGRLRPTVVFSKGGFVSFPVAFAAWCWRVPVVAHESDLTPGLANRLAMPFVRSLCTNFPATKPHRFNGELVYTGTPVRSELLSGDAETGRRLVGAESGQPVIVVTGGSLGADRINAVVREAAAALCERAVLVHVCGPGKVVPVDQPGYHPFEYVRAEWGNLLAAATLVISRAGANTLYELLCLRKPNLLIPLSRKASRGDQIENAAWAEAEGYSHVLAEETLTPESLIAAVDEILAETEADSGKIAGFQPPDSVGLIVATIEQAVQKT
jgi:UDP-N-acetylglucosamine--N-acetylmuramyl-(pentapeptide) pyrophosphoryl-undecaprenol N-acetylglucosamine transferase